IVVGAVVLGGIAWSRAPGLDGLAHAAQDGDAVPALLAMPDRLVAKRGKRFDRKRLVGALELLQPDDVRRGFLEPASEHMHPRIDPVDVVARDSQPPFRHAFRTPLARFRCRPRVSHAY